jgi:predicted transcriptional regulator YheO
MSKPIGKKSAYAMMRPVLADIAAGVARQFGADCEVAVHNLTGDSDHTIDYIENGHVTGRKKGDGPSEVVLEALRDGDIDNRYDYVTQSKDGRMLKSSTIAVRDEAGSLIALFSINYDISALTLAHKTISDFLSMNDEASDGTIVDNVSDLLENLIEESRKLIGKPVSAMTKDDKVEAIKYLDRKGAFLIKKSSDRVAEFFAISKYTLYNYLGGQE